MRRLALIPLFVFLVACAGAPVRDATTGPLRASLHAEESAVGLVRYPAAGDPVLLVGPPGVSAGIFDVPGFGGLAPWLQGEGYDVTVLDWNSLPQEATLAELAPWVERAARHLGREGKPVSVVTFSLGGIPVLHADLAERVARFVFVAVPVELGTPMEPVRAFADKTWSRAHHPREAAAYIRVKTDRPLLGDLLWNYGVEPVDPRWLEAQLEPVGPRMLTEIGTALRAGNWGEKLRRRVAGIDVPLTVLTGAADALVPPWQAHPLYRKAGTRTKIYHSFTRLYGDRKEYGHGGLLLGDGAARDVFPRILDGLRLEHEPVDE